MKKTITLKTSLLIMLFAFAACGEKKNNSASTPQLSVKETEHVSDKLIGSWVAPVNGMPDMVEGMKLDEGGVASSINMATLIYKSWQSTGNNKDENTDYLILSGKSVGNGITIDFTDTLKINKLTADSLIVTNGDYTRAYYRQK